MATTTTTTNTTQLEAIEKLPSVSANPDDHATIDSVHTAIEPVTDPEVTIHGWWMDKAPHECSLDI